MSPPRPTGRDLVPLAVFSVAFSILLGTALMTVCLLINRVLIRDLPPSATPDFGQPAAFVLLAGLLSTLVLPAVTAWSLLAPVGSTYRRGGLSMVSGFGAVVVSLVSIPLNEFFGLNGLVALLVISLGTALALGRRVTRERSAI